jgi:hypothetical protein
MLAQLKRVSRRNIAFVWAMIAVFALAPALSLAAAVPAGAFSRLLVHSHDGAELGQIYLGDHHQHVHEHGDGHHHDHGAGDVDEHDQSQPQSHIHYEAGCPSIVVPDVVGTVMRHHLRHRVAIRLASPMRGAPPDQLLRPPIL